MTAGRAADATVYASSAETLVERIFGAVDSLRDQVIGCRSAALSRHERWQAKHLAEIRPGLTGLLRAHRDIVVGMGMIVAPGLLPGERHRLEWWQLPPGRDQPSALQVDLNPDSLGFYDYGSAEWFSVPRRTGRRHIVGPYVDALGTDRYLLTFTAPVLADGVFLGVVGADVPVSRFERHLLCAWQVGWPVQVGGAARPGIDVQTDVFIINSQGRVVVSNCAHALSGDLVSDDAGVGTLRLDLPDVPWRLLLSERLPT